MIGSTCVKFSGKPANSATTFPTWILTTNRSRCKEIQSVRDFCGSCLPGWRIRLSGGGSLLTQEDSGKRACCAFPAGEQRGLPELAVARAILAVQQTLGTGTAGAAGAAVGCVARGTGTTLPALPADTEEEGNASKGSGKQDYVSFTG